MATGLRSTWSEQVGVFSPEVGAARVAVGRAGGLSSSPASRN
ncbi:hypothetical protein ACU4GD_02765 [Cupriavidus basilensis]